MKIVINSRSLVIWSLVLVVYSATYYLELISD